MEEMKEAVTKVIDTLTHEDFHRALEWYNKCIADGGVYFKGDESFIRVLSMKVPLRKKSGNLFNDPRPIPLCLQLFYRYEQIKVEQMLNSG